MQNEVATQGETTLCWLILCRPLADPFQEQGRWPPTPHTNSDAPKCTENPCRVCFLYGQVCQPQRGAAGRGTALHPPGPWAVLRCSSDRRWREGRGLFPFLVISGARTVLGTQHSTSFCCSLEEGAKQPPSCLSGRESQRGDAEKLSCDQWHR